MSDLDIDIARTALVLIDLQNSNVKRDLAPYTAEQVVGNCVLLAGEMRDRGGMVIFVRVLVDELQLPPADAPLRKPGTPAPPPDASLLAPEAQVQAADIVITKRQWGAFYGTDLDQLLRRRNIRIANKGSGRVRWPASDFGRGTRTRPRPLTRIIL